MSRRQFWFLVGVTCAVLLYKLATAHAGTALLGGVGKLMSPGSNGGSSPSTPFTITTEAGTALTTEAGSALVTQAAP